MKKYDEQFKLSVVQEYEGGALGLMVLGRRHGLSESMVRRWVAQYRQRGLAGLRRKYSHYGAEFKLSVLRRMWREKLSRSQVMAMFDLRGHSVVTLWERQYHAGILEPRTMKGPPPKPPGPEDTRTLEDLRKENEELRAEVAYLKKLDALIQAKQQVAPRKRK
jgi:transposase